MDLILDLVAISDWAERNRLHYELEKVIHRALRFGALKSANVVILCRRLSMATLVYISTVQSVND